jgi:hypothetical protein
VSPAGWTGEPVVLAKLGMRRTVRGLRRLGTSSPQVIINCHKSIRVRGRLVWVRVVITEISWDGSIRRRAPGTSGLTDAGRWENLIEQVLAFPPPYRAAPGRSVYVIHAADRAVLVGEQDLTGPLRDLVTTILAWGDPALAASRAIRPQR